MNPMDEDYRQVSVRDVVHLMDMFENDLISWDFLWAKTPLFIEKSAYLNLAIKYDKLKFISSYLDMLEIPKENMNLKERLSYHYLMMET